mmetsp:Transcript_32365/g.69932  ORF Transcript_32365/g.69932 Transcript_32365/m.69932 type:complete len:184 (-) Transcript_32365:257-808(-)
MGRACHTALNASLRRSPCLSMRYRVVSVTDLTRAHPKTQDNLPVDTRKAVDKHWLRIAECGVDEIDAAANHIFGKYLSICKMKIQELHIFRNIWEGMALSGGAIHHALNVHGGKAFQLTSPPITKKKTWNHHANILMMAWGRGEPMPQLWVQQRLRRQERFEGAPTYTNVVSSHETSGELLLS